MMSKFAAQPDEKKSSKRKKYSEPFAKPIPDFSLIKIASCLPPSSLAAFSPASKKFHSSAMVALMRGSYRVTDWNFVPRPPEHALSAPEAAAPAATRAAPLAAARSAEESDSDGDSDTDWNTDRDTDYDTDSDKDSDATVEYKEEEEPTFEPSWSLKLFAESIDRAIMPTLWYQQHFMIKFCPKIKELEVPEIGGLVDTRAPINTSVKRIIVTGLHRDLFLYQLIAGLKRFEGLESLTVERLALEPGRVRDMLSNKDELSKVKVGSVTLVLKQIGRSAVDGREECKLTWRKEVKGDSGVDGLFVDDDLD